MRLISHIKGWLANGKLLHLREIRGATLPCDPGFLSQCNIKLYVFAREEDRLLILTWTPNESIVLKDATREK